jgi:prepilin-type processing-associated H-X9-DG protein
MGNRKGLTLVDVLVTVSVVLFLLAVLIPVFDHGHGCRWSVVCGTNLKGLGTAMMIYGNDYEDAYPQLPGKGPWSKRLGFDYDMESPDFGPGGAQEYNSRTITASWYLLVREADVSPKSFVCIGDATPEVPFEWDREDERDIMELWDFGGEPHKHVSYVMHSPYGKHPANGALGSSFAVAADMSPWMARGDFVAPGADGGGPQLILDDWSKDVRVEKSRIQAANSSYHDHYGQNVLFADGHAAFERRSDVGMGYDGIDTYQGQGDDIRIGTNPTGRNKENDAKSEDDSFLAL